MVENSKSFVLGISQVLQINELNEFLICGRLRGTIKLGDTVCVFNPGDDNCNASNAIITLIQDVNNTSVTQATDCKVKLVIKFDKKHLVKIGTLVCSEERTINEVYKDYTNAILNGYIIDKDMKLSTEDLDKLSITDCAEVWTLFVRRCIESNLVNSENIAKIDIIARELCKKIFEADTIYCVYNKKTGEPHLFSYAKKRDGQYACTLPNILIFTEAYKKIMLTYFTNETFEVRKIRNGENKNGIYNFLWNVFYLNGASAVRVVSEEVAIANSSLISPPDYRNVEPQNIPVTNPDFVGCSGWHHQYAGRWRCHHYDDALYRFGPAHWCRQRY